MESYKFVSIICLLVSLSVYGYGAEPDDFADVIGSSEVVRLSNIEVKAKGYCKGSFYGKYKSCFISQSSDWHEITLDIGDERFVGRTEAISKLNKFDSIEQGLSADLVLYAYAEDIPDCSVTLLFNCSANYRDAPKEIFNGKNPIEYMHKIIDSAFRGSSFSIKGTEFKKTYTLSHKRRFSL